MDVAAQTDGTRQVGSGREINSSAVCCGRRLDCLVDGIAVRGFAVCLRAEVFDIRHCGAQGQSETGQEKSKNQLFESGESHGEVFSSFSIPLLKPPGTSGGTHLN